MPLFALGLNYRTAPIEIRERVAFPLEAQRGAIDALRAETDGYRRCPPYKVSI